MSATVIIPARLASSRFPEKVLAARTGRPLVQHCVDQVRRCRHVREVIVAADDARTEAALRPFGTRVVLTDPNLPSGSDRVAAVARGLADEIIVNVQGDEPEIEPEIVDQLIERMLSSRDDMATCATPFADGLDPANPNLVKVIADLSQRAIYFSRSPVPFYRDTPGSGQYLLHLGLYAYRREFLLKYTSWSPTPLEKAEKLEQLRVLEHGGSIGLVLTQRPGHGIDTPEQYEAFVRRYQAHTHR